MAKVKIIRPIRSEADYDEALKEIERYFNKEPKPGTADADRFDLLALVIEDYEKKRWPIEPPDPVEAIRYRMTLGNFNQGDLAKVLGSRQRASEILARQRPVTMEMAWKLHRKWGIPADALIRPQLPDLSKRRRVTSSAISDIRYDPSRRALHITFVSDKQYIYARVPKSVYEAFRSAESKGTFFNKFIRDAYAFQEVTQLAG
jgi:HTH-type transcriptional regulator/antitoxin HigA